MLGRPCAFGFAPRRLRPELEREPGRALLRKTPSEPQLPARIGEPETELGCCRVALVEHAEAVADARIEAPCVESGAVLGAETGERRAPEQRIRAAPRRPAHRLGELHREPPLGPRRGVEGERPRKAALAEALGLVGQQPPGPDLRGDPSRGV